MFKRSKVLTRRLCIIGLCVGVSLSAACGDDSAANPDAGMIDAAAGDGGTDSGADAGTDVGTDAPVDAGADAFDAGTDASFMCEADQWRDFSTTTCMDCPGGSISCEDFDLEMAELDLEAGTLTIPLMGGITEIVDGTFILTVRTTEGETLTVDATLTVDGNTLIGDLSELPADFEALEFVSWDLNDSCDTNHTSSGDIQAPGSIGEFACES